MSYLAFGGASVYKSIEQTLTDTVEAALTPDTERYDKAGLWSGGTPSRIIPGPGKWLIQAKIAFYPDADGNRTVQFRKNGTDYLGSDIERAPSATQSAYIAGSTIADLVAGDYVECMVVQSSGGNLNIFASDAAQQYASDFIATKVY